jgi:2-dehydro-3-deoxygluconokinase
MSGLFTIGETMVKLTAASVGPLRHVQALGLGVAGAESNVAIGVRRLGHNATWAGRVGDDEFGQLVLARLRGEQVEVFAHADPDAPTGLMITERRSAELRRVTYYRHGSAGSRLHAADIPLDSVRRAGVVHVTGITAALSAGALEAVQAVVAEARGAGVPISLDVNYRAALWSRDTAERVLRPLAAAADIVFAGDERRLLVDEDDPKTAARAIARLGPATAVVTLGAGGAVAHAAGEDLRAPALAVTAVDPIGAGDAFVAGYLSGLLDRQPPAACLALAGRTAAFAVTVDGDWEGLPSREDLRLLDHTAGDVLR